MASTKTKLKAIKSTPNESTLYELIDPASILNGRNPRTYFDQNAMAELVESVRLHGLIQPVLLRKDEATGSLHLVCGERRLRAAKEAGLSLIPATVRIMDEKLAFELSIIENLQRKDVHPLEEAQAIADMQEFGFSLEDITIKLAKSLGYVTQRAKFNNLIPHFKTHFFDGIITYKDAFKLARIPQETQNNIFTELSKHAQNYNRPINYDSIERYISTHQGNLSKASFDISDDKLLPSAGACVNCPHNSACNSLLFPDLAENPTCSKPSCYSEKTKLFIDIQFNRVIEENLVVVHNTYAWDRTHSELLEKFRSNGVPVYVLHEFDFLGSAPVKYTWDEFCLEMDVDIHSLSVLEHDEDDFEELKEQHQELLDSFDEDLAEFQEKELLAVPAFVLGSSSNGQILNVILKPKQATEGKANGKTSVEKGATAAEKEVALANIERKRERGKELDSQKVYSKIIAHIPTIPAYIKPLETEDDSLNPAELDALFYFVWEKMNWDDKTHVNQLLFNEKYFSATTEQLLNLTPQQKNFIIRTSIYGNNKSEFATGVTKDIMLSIANSYPEIPINLIEQEQEAARVKREQKLDEKKRLIEEMV